MLKTSCKHCDIMPVEYLHHAVKSFSVTISHGKRSKHSYRTVNLIEHSHITDLFVNRFMKQKRNINIALHGSAHNRMNI